MCHKVCYSLMCHKAYAIALCVVRYVIALCVIRHVIALCVIRHVIALCVIRYVIVMGVGPGPGGYGASVRGRPTHPFRTPTVHPKDKIHPETATHHLLASRSAASLPVVQVLFLFSPF